MRSDSDLPKHSIRISKRAKYIRLQVTPEKGLEVILPRESARRRVPALLRERRDWIEQQTGAMQQRRQRWLDHHGTAAPSEVSLPPLGQHWPVRYQADSTLRRARVIDGQLIVPATQLSEQYRYLHDWAREQAREHLPAMTRRLASELGFDYKKTSIRAQKTRWGSCSSSGTLSLNWKLVLLPADWAEYVLVHELCHTRHMNHSAAFHQLLARHIPDYRRIEQAMQHAWRHLPPWSEQQV